MPAGSARAFLRSPCTCQSSSAAGFPAAATRRAPAPPRTRPGHGARVLALRAESGCATSPSPASAVRCSRASSARATPATPAAVAAPRPGEDPAAPQRRRLSGSGVLAVRVAEGGEVGAPRLLRRPDELAVAGEVVQGKEEEGAPGAPVQQARRLSAGRRRQHPVGDPRGLVEEGPVPGARREPGQSEPDAGQPGAEPAVEAVEHPPAGGRGEIGRASCRERAYDSVDAVYR